MKFHKIFQVYIDFLTQTFPDIPKLETLYRNFVIIKTIIANKNSASVEEICIETNFSEQRVRVRLRELCNEEILSVKTEKKPNESYRKNYYSSLYNEEFIKTFGKYTKCFKCGRDLGKFGGVVHYNISNEESIAKIFCSKNCRNEWCYSNEARRIYGN